MIGLGTAINMGLIVGGSLIGLAFGRFMKENLKQTLMMVSGIIVLLLGMSGAMQFMLVIVNGSLQTSGPLLMIVSMVLWEPSSAPSALRCHRSLLSWR